MKDMKGNFDGIDGRKGRGRFLDRTPAEGSNGIFGEGEGRGSRGLSAWTFTGVGENEGSVHQKFFRTMSTWEQQFSGLFQSAVEKYREGHQKADGLVDEKGRKFLASIGHTEQEFFDFVEDFAKAGEPTLETALKIASVRRDYFLKEQNGVFSPHRISMDDLPSKDAEVEGI